ncbi:peptidoglycan D,D-transpeptidase FtsI family protein [Alkaliphilus transvaalensis]|uniref:peptidoglycan D,D-transpeptidase FtsI family protein n=1 Tax=Alkaliphilus transvaalensis TaxID=114628 RepID=UPI0004790CED|nr:penicillin-binding transpeptidase domain-containing protein [Alkaliphilus transvaalensis]
MRKNRKNRVDGDDLQINTNRIIIMGVVASTIIVALIGRLFYLQVMRHEFYTTEVNKQRNVTIPLTSGRGTIYDRNFIPLTERSEDTIGIVYPQLFQRTEENLQFLSDLTGSSPLELDNRIKRSNNLIELSIKGDLDWNDRRLVNTRGLFVIEKKNRYDDEKLLSHVIGYISTIDKRGMSGLEKSLNDLLKGQEGRAIAAVLDGRKRLLPGEGYTMVSGVADERNVKLTIDYHLQKIVEEALDRSNDRGAVIISNIETGEILSLASRPNFNPNDIATHLRSDGDELFNKAIQLTFPPGSIFKIVVAAAALEENLVELDDVFFCSGAEQVGNVVIRCNSFNQGGNGEITFAEAFAESCNSTFIQVGQRLGAKKIIEMAEALGFNQKIGIGLEEEEQGNLPKGDNLLGPAIGNISIGQGLIEVTPLQVNQLTQMIANNGVKMPLHLIEGVVNKEHEKIVGFDDFKNREAEIDPLVEEGRLSQGTISKLQHMMELTMTQGTGRNVGDLSNLTAGKTGTAQSTEKGQPVLHGWFTGYYPVENPQYAITVFLQNGQSGGQYAVPVFKEIIEKLIRLGY